MPEHDLLAAMSIAVARLEEQVHEIRRSLTRIEDGLDHQATRVEALESWRQRAQGAAIVVSVAVGLCGTALALLIKLL